jgi:hypothetical protein
MSRASSPESRSTSRTGSDHEAACLSAWASLMIPCRNGLEGLVQARGGDCVLSDRDLAGDNLPTGTPPSFKLRHYPRRAPGFKLTHYPTATRAARPRDVGPVLEARATMLFPLTMPRRIGTRIVPPLALRRLQVGGTIVVRLSLHGPTLRTESEVHLLVCAPRPSTPPEGARLLGQRLLPGHTAKHTPADQNAGEPAGNRKGTQTRLVPRQRTTSAHKFPAKWQAIARYGCATVISERRDALRETDFEEPKANLGGTRASNDIQPVPLKCSSRA